MNFREKTILGKTGLKIGRMGISSSYGAPASAFEEAFDMGCNYFSIGSFIKGRSRAMYQAIRNITSNGKREELVVSMYDYTHSRVYGPFHFMKGLRKMGLEYVDILILGYYPMKPGAWFTDWALKLKHKGLVRHLGLSSHNRSLFPGLATESDFDVFHIRYNAVNSGAEKDIFPRLPADNSPGIVSFTATRWGQLLNPKKMPEGEEPLKSTDCYRFVLSHPSVDVCMTGARNQDMLRENLRTLDMGPLNDEEMKRVRKIGDHIYGKPR